MTETVDSLKQRIVGALVLISLAVIFLPMIFDEPHYQQENVIIPVPPRPSFEFKEIEKPAKPEFQRFEFNVNENRVEEVEDIAEASIGSDQNENDESTPGFTLVDISDKEKRPSESQVKPVQETETISQKSIHSAIPKVSHLPVFKNVWMVQLGTFGKTENAYQLRDELRKAGFDGHTKKIPLNGGTAVQVFTGPFVDKSQAEKIKIQVDKKFKIDSRVIFFDA